MRTAIPLLSSAIALALTGSMQAATRQLETNTTHNTAAIAQSISGLEAAGFAMKTSGDSAGITYETWVAEDKRSWFLLMWTEQDYPAQDPEATAFFDTPVVFVSTDVLTACYAVGDDCSGLAYQGCCSFSWQYAFDGSLCGDRARFF
ncbi:hypothetical protein [Sphaerothrix gracilis]|uniref:hypothetical protein n=1 Tax=Sphaerothrix gracilis TaxID=3151835 RepID=UPI0031FBC3DD